MLIFELLFCALKYEDYISISSYKKDKEILDNLCITYEKTNEVKKSCMNIVLYNYESFDILLHESISDVHSLY